MNDRMSATLIGRSTRGGKDGRRHAQEAKKSDYKGDTCCLLMLSIKSGRLADIAPTETFDVGPPFT
eukprot:scaffold91071_cov33-Tisochrysis_lutea.AAC.5